MRIIGQNMLHEITDFFRIVVFGRGCVWSVEILKNNPEIKRELAAAKATDPKLAESASAQLEFI